jgi:hypothetical protein
MGNTHGWQVLHYVISLLQPRRKIILLIGFINFEEKYFFLLSVLC